MLRYSRCRDRLAGLARLADIRCPAIFGTPPSLEQTRQVSIGEVGLVKKRIRKVEAQKPYFNRLDKGGYRDRQERYSDRQNKYSERREQQESTKQKAKKNAMSVLFKPVDLQSDTRVSEFYSVCEQTLQKVQDRDQATTSLCDSEIGSAAREKAFDILISKIHTALRNTVQVNSDSVWQLVRTSREEHSLCDPKDILDEFTKDMMATPKSYLEYENDVLAFTSYVQNPPVIPELGKIYALFNNLATGVPAIQVESLIRQVMQLTAGSFLRYFRAKIRISFSQSSKTDNLTSIDMTNPGEWYPEARALRRNVILHIGPTNSGKTYSALQALQKAGSGYYAGPLRLLAREVYNRFKSSGKPCNLVTGEEVIEDYDQFGMPVKLSCGTVEMVDLNQQMDVAVIDEIQMIEDNMRGWAWTHAFLGVQAREVHLCGDPSAENIIRRLVARTGDNLEVRHYKRLSPLVVDRKPMSEQLKNMENGDCIVAFSKRTLMDFKTQVEKRTKSNCAIIYGALPPESRSHQAELFNQQDSGYNFLVASDAVGMGLNLSIRRIIFLTTRKFDGISNKPISISQIKQIAGRAGRYRVAPSSSSSSTSKPDSEEDVGGSVTAFSSADLKYIRKCLDSETPRIEKGGLFPSESLFRQYALPLYSQSSLHKVLERMEVASELGASHFLCGVENMTLVSELFDTINRLTLNEKLVLAKAPVKLRFPACVTAFKDFCTVVSQSKSVTLLDISSVRIDELGKQGPFVVKDIETFETIHNIIVLYLWLSYRFPMNFTDREGAFELKILCEKLIDQGLVDTRSKRLARWIRKQSKMKGKEDMVSQVDSVDHAGSADDSASEVNAKNLQTNAVLMGKEGQLMSSDDFK